ncbi:unnamed protein product [Calypogeia fissa]
MDQSLNFSVSKDEKLNGNNYPIWSYKMEQNYIKERVWYVIRENIRGAAVNPNDPSNPTPAERRADQSKALYMLTKAVDDQILARYTNICDLAILWAELKRACAGNTLATVDVSLTDEDLNDFVIDALPSSWEIFGSVIAGRETSPIFVQLENLICEEEIRKSSRAFAGEEALFARSDGQFSNRGRSNAGGRSRSYNTNNTGSNPGRGRGVGQQSNKARGFCHICNDPSHWANTCPFKGLKSELDSAIARVSHLKVTADQVLEANLSELASSNSNHPWILDYGANTHLTSEPMGLSHLVSVSPGPTVATVGGPALNIKGKETLFFGKNKVEDVLYVPCARHNLLSVGKITDFVHSLFHFQAMSSSL